MPATTPDYLSSIPPTQVKRTSSYKLSNCYTTAVDTSHTHKIISVIKNNSFLSLWFVLYYTNIVYMHAPVSTPLCGSQSPRVVRANKQIPLIHWIISLTHRITFFKQERGREVCHHFSATPEVVRESIVIVLMIYGWGESSLRYQVSVLQDKTLRNTDHSIVTLLPS